MNKRIKKLLKQATTDINPQDREWVFSRVDQIKFAELVIMDVASKLEPVLASEILELYGIEE
jgi:hypothetical protein